MAPLEAEQHLTPEPVRKQRERALEGLWMRRQQQTVLLVARLTVGAVDDEPAVGAPMLGIGRKPGASGTDDPSSAQLT